jgi:hypothetical protein
MSVRFVIPQKDQWSGCRLGIFQAISVLRESGDLCLDEEDYVLEVLGWFNQNLEAPSRLTRTQHRHPMPSAICWYRDSAREYIARMWDIVTILEEHNRLVQFIRTGRPGYITYEDRFQIAAVPFSDTKTSDRIRP